MFIFLPRDCDPVEFNYMSDNLIENILVVSFTETLEQGQSKEIIPHDQFTLLHL